MHDLLYSRNHASLPRADCPCPYPPPHQLPCHPLSRPYTTLTTRGSIRPFLEPTAPNPHAPLHRGDYHKAPCQHALMPSLLSSRLSCPMHPPIPPPSAAAPFVSRSTIRPFLEVTVPILHISTFSCRFDTPMHSRLAQLRLWRLHAPLPSRASPISDCLNLPPRHALPGSPVSSRTRLIPKWLPVRLLSCPARHSRPHAPLPRADCPNPLPRPHHMLLWLPDQLTCATAYPFSLLHQLLGFPARPLRPHAPRFALTAPPHQPLTPPRLSCRSQHECSSVIAPWTNARPWSLHALLRRADCTS